MEHGEVIVRDEGLMEHVVELLCQVRYYEKEEVIF